MRQRLRYGTWIRMKRLITFWAIAALFLSAIVLVLITPWFLLMLLPAVAFTYIAVILTLAHWHFSRRGGDFQNKIHDLMLSHKPTPGDTIDIGCGNGNLIIKVAKKDRSSSHLGLDSWGKNWEYSIGQCEVNVRIEGVENVTFVRGSAAHTGLDSNRYACVLSCLTFHEVRDDPDKSHVVKEALRLLRPGGTFVLFDLFDDRKHYPRLDLILETIEDAGCAVTTNEPLRNVAKLPFPLNDGKVLRYARLLSGTKGL